MEGIGATCPGILFATICCSLIFESLVGIGDAIYAATLPSIKENAFEFKALVFILSTIIVLYCMFGCFVIGVFGLLFFNLMPD